MFWSRLKYEVMLKKILSNLFHKNAEYDEFPINLLESKGTIKRESFHFTSSRMILYGNGTKQEISIRNSIDAEVLYNGYLRVSFTFLPFGNQIANITYPEVSENKDRILWSINLLRGGQGTAADIPSFMSLFYIKGQLSRVAFSFKNVNPEFLVEYYL